MATQTIHNPAQPPDNSIAATPAPLAWLTLEVLLYGVVLVMAVALRLWRLGAYPLSAAEAQQALDGLALYLGQPVEGGGSPLLVTLNALSFLLFNHSDTTARLGPALLGSALVLLPLLLRRQLGHRATLLAATLLAISPTALFLSRTLNAEIATAAGAMLLFAGGFNWLDNGRPRWLYAMAGGLALLLTSGPMAYSVLIVFALVVLARWPAFKSLWAGRMAPAESGDGGASPASDLRRAGLFFAAALLLLATAGTLNLGGFGETTALPGNWLSRFSLAPRADAGFNGVFLLTVTEPLLLAAGVAGLALAFLSRNLVRQSIAIWFLGAALLDLVMAGRPTGAVMLSLLPLALLAGLALAHLWESLAAEGRWSNEGIVAVAGLIILTFGYIGLTGWIERPCATDDNLCNYAWLQAVAALLLFVVIVAFFWFLNGAGAALRGAAITFVVIGLIATISIGWRLNYGPLMRLAFKPLAGTPASTELVALRDVLTRESLIRSGDNAMLDIALINVDDPALLWQLRRFKRLSAAASPLEAAGATAIITPAGELGEANLGEAYLGQDFTLNAEWSPVGLGTKDLLYWLIYRQLPLAPGGEQVVLWFSLTPRG
ncbi:MAG: hypothetical protein Kow0031_08750 [Anaerolineae bacterium]